MSILQFLNPREPTRRPLEVYPLSLDSFKSELKDLPFLSEEEKTTPPTQQTWEEIRQPKLRRYPTCGKILVEELIDDHGEEGFVFRVKIDGTGPYVLKIFKQLRRPSPPKFWPFYRECLYYSRAEAVNAGALSGATLPMGPPPGSYTDKDMARVLRSFSSDWKGNGNGKLRRADPNHEYDVQIHKILSEMDGSLGWIRLDRDDINHIIYKWELDVGYTMNGEGFQENPFGIVKTFVESDVALNYLKMLQWIDLAEYMGYGLNVFEPRNWVGSGTLVDAADVLTLPFCGRRKDVAMYYKNLRRKFQSNFK